MSNEKQKVSNIQTHETHCYTEIQSITGIVKNNFLEKRCVINSGVHRTNTKRQPANFNHRKTRLNQKQEFSHQRENQELMADLY